MSRAASVFVVSIAALVSFARVAAAQSPGEAEPAPPPAGEMPPPAIPAAPVPPSDDDGVPGAGAVVVPAATVSDDGNPVRPADLSYGVSARLRWVSVPKFMLNPFTKQNVPLSSWATGFEFFRRKGNFDLVASFSYINLSPP